MPSLLVVMVGAGRAVGSSNSSSSAQSGRLSEGVKERWEHRWKRCAYFANLDMFIILMSMVLGRKI